MPRSHRSYNRISITQDTDSTSPRNDNSPLSEPLSPSTSFDDTNIETAVTNPNLPPIYHEITVNLLDGAHSKFSITADPSWTVEQFKTASSAVTKVPPESQRLIYMGKLLQDSKTLRESGIEESEVIIHLFPKPNVVITNPSENTTANTENNEAESFANETPSGAHVPQIILDPAEAASRSQILILSSHEIFEAQHRVKIFSFLLMILTSMELLTLLTLYVGVDDENSYPPSAPGNPTDVVPNSNNNVRTWQNSDYADAVLSGFGFYVSLLGIKATAENTLVLARRYFTCLLVAGVANNIYYYYLNVNQMTKTAADRNEKLDGPSLYGGSFVGILLPLTVWVVCIVRAWQFQLLIREAEVEARERTARQGQPEQQEGSIPEGGGTVYGSGESGVLPVAYAEEISNDLELQVERTGGVAA